MALIGGPRTRLHSIGVAFCGIGSVHAFCLLFVTVFFFSQSSTVFTTLIKGWGTGRRQCPGKVITLPFSLASTGGTGGGLLRNALVADRRGSGVETALLDFFDFRFR